MSLMTRAGLLAGAAALTLTGVGHAGTTTDARNDQLIQDLQARIVELERRQGDNWLTEQRADEIRALVHDVLADADTRASLLSSGMTAGYDNGFQVGSADGNFLLQINGQLQGRWMYNRQSSLAPAGVQSQFGNLVIRDGAGAPASGAFLLGALFGGNANTPIAGPVAHDGHRSGFENSRAKLWFSGHVINPNWQYMIEADFSQNGAALSGVNGTFTLLDAYISHQYGDTGLVITLGQFKLPFLREELIDSRYQQAVERSLVNSYFTAGRSTGLMVSWEQEMFRAFGALSDGSRMQNTPAAAYGTEWSVTGRGEVLLAGNWGQFNEFRSAPGEEFGLLLGAALHWQRDEYGTTGPVVGAAFVATEVQRLSATVDLHAKFGGWNLYGAYIFNEVDVRTPGASTWQNHAWIIQGGVHLTDEWELFGRYEGTHWDNFLRTPGSLALISTGVPGFALQDLHVITAGVNHYMWGAGHSAKWTTDIGYGLNRVSVGDVRAGYGSDAGFGTGNNGQIVFRTQLQLAF